MAGGRLSGSTAIVTGASAAIGEVIAKTFAAVTKGEANMEVKSTLKVIDAAGLKSHAGVCKGQTMKQLVGFPELPTDRIRASLATYEAGALEELHWMNWPGAGA